MLFSPSFIILALANFFSTCSFSAFFLFPLFISDQGGSKADIGIIMGVFTLAAVLFRPWISQVIDRIGRKRSYTIGCLINTLLSLSYLFLQGDLKHVYLYLLLIRVIHGIGLAFCFTAAFTYIVDIIPLNRLNEGIGLFGITGLSGMAVGPVMAEKILGEFGFTGFFIMVSGLGMLNLLLHLPIADAYVPAAGGATPSFLAVLARRKILVLAFLAFLFGFGLSATGNFVSPFAKEQHIGFISYYYIFYSGAAVMTRLVGGRLADRVGEERIIPYALVLTGLGLFMLIFLGGSNILVLSGFITGLGHGFLYPCLNALTIRNEPIFIRGKITGIYTGGIDAGIFAGSLALGYLGEYAGFRVLFFAAGSALFIGLLIYLSQFKKSMHPFS